MSENNNMTWIPFYTEFADKLLKYKDNRKELLDKLQKVFSDVGMKFPKLEEDNSIRDIDPFTVYGFFNKHITDKNRKAIIASLISEFNLSASVPNDFDGIPVLNNLMAVLFSWNRNDDDIDNLWDFFSIALLYSKRKTDDLRTQFIKMYDKVRTQDCIRWNITMALFWVRPYSFINLDSRNRNFMKSAKNISENVASEIKGLKDVPNGEKYLEICEICAEVCKSGIYPYNTFPELSYTAWLSNPDEDTNDNTTVDNLTSDNAWLLAWNPKKYDWEHMDEKNNYYTMLKTVQNGGEYSEAWRCQSTKVKKGDMVFIIRLGTAPKGIVAKGYAASESYVKDGTNLIDITITDTLDYKNQDIISQDLLKEKFPEQQWSPQGSGISIKPDAAQWLIENWNDYSYNNIDYLSKNSKEKEPRRYWLYAPGDKAWLWDECYNNGFMALSWSEMDDIRQYHSREELKIKLQQYYNNTKSFNADTLALWNYAYVMKPGDIIICKKGLHKIVGCGIVESDYEYDDSREYFRHVRKVNWTHYGEWDNPGPTIMKTLTDITSNPKYIKEIMELIGIDETNFDKPEIQSPYTKEDFLKDVFVTEKEYDRLKALLLRKKNIILQGAPGVGKTYAAKRLAYSIIGEKNESRICMVQFHQSYSYEDFIMGYRPNDSGGFELRTGIFYNFCERCKENPNEHYFFIIDEINRGNMSKIFGELLMLIETDKRGENNTINLAYGGRTFFIPDNLHIIGMMNTADRSLAMIDYALRRRFSFCTMSPAFENVAENGFKEYTDKIDCPLYHRIISEIKALNVDIRRDSSLGKGFEIGHSYFSPVDITVIDDEWVRSVIDYEIIPLIEEYWFDDEKKAEEHINTLYRALGEEHDGR